MVIVVDADVEDNIESDVSRNRFQALDTTVSMDTAKLAGGSHDNNGTLPVQTSPEVCCTKDTEGAEEDHKMDTKDKVEIEEVTQAMNEMALEADQGQTVNNEQENLKTEPVDGASDIKHVVNQDPCDEEEDKDRTSICDSKPKKSKKEKKVEARLKAMNSLSPRYTPVAHECSVMSCLNQFTSAELLTGNNKFGCEKCTRRKNSSQSDEGEY